MAKGEQSSGEFSHHEPCPKCESSDALARYTCGGAHCFSCDYHEFADGATTADASAETQSQPDSKESGLITEGVEYQPLTKRKLTVETCEKWNYQVGTKSGKPVQIANYFKDRKKSAQKIRFPDKSFVCVGPGKKDLGLFGQHLWRDGGKKVVITEGEIDAMTVSQLQNHKWPVVSVPNGAQGAKKSLAKEIEWLEQFEEIVLMFDMDEPGQAAILECVTLFTPGKCKIARLPLKDASEMHMAGRGSEVIQAIWDAKVYRPESVLSVEDALEEALRMPSEGIPWPWPSLTKLTYGIQRKTSYYLGAGVGVGKTNWAKELQSHLVNVHGLPVGVFMLEEAVGRTLKGIAGKFVGKAFHKPDGSFTQQELESAIRSLDGKVYLYNHSVNGTDWDSIKSAIRYMVVSCGVKDIFLDNITVMVAHLDASEANEEVIRIADEIKKLTHELDCTVYGFSHLNAPSSGPSHERGGRVQEYQFTGSRALMRFGNYLFGLSRNKDPELPEDERNLATFELLKDREYGNSGLFYIRYNSETDQFLEPHGFGQEESQF